MPRLLLVATLTLLPLQAAALTIIVPMPPADFPEPAPDTTRDLPRER
ncbi:hypothetical protein [Jannaschia formosa]|nr:hypothetical protein [Jannaschia formosa]